MASTVIIQGEKGAYSHLAALKIFKNPNIICSKTFEDAFAQTKKTRNSFLLIPIENSIAGKVADVYYLLSPSKLKGSWRAFSANRALSFRYKRLIN